MNEGMVLSAGTWYVSVASDMLCDKDDLERHGYFTKISLVTYTYERDSTITAISTRRHVVVWNSANGYRVLPLLVQHSFSLILFLLVIALCKKERLQDRTTNLKMMNLFGKKKTPTSTVSASSTTQPSDPQKTIVKLRETIANQEKRWVNSVFVMAISIFQSESRNHLGF
jgi:hypothetical protein